MNSAWSNVPPPPGTQGQYGYLQSECDRDLNSAHRQICHSLSPIPRTAADTPTAPPAYTPVLVRSSFASAPIHYAPQITSPPYPTPIQYPSAASAPSSEEPPRKKVEWPQGVRDYVRRSFEPQNMLAEVTKSEMEAKLKSTITAATDAGELFSINWESLPLPQEMIRKERATAQAAMSWQQYSVDLHSGGNARANTSVTTSAVPKKRKSLEMDPDDNSSLPPWRTANNRALEDRMGRQPTKDDRSSKSAQRLEKRAKKFGTPHVPRRSPTPEPSRGPVVGTSSTLEKRYLRLTAAPIPSQVRPEPILRQTLDLSKKKWKKDANYNYVCDQFKSMRQDLTVQHIKNDFTVSVYEIHSRIALEKGDLGEYNQCQTQLRALYAQHLGGNPMEFKAYRILYFIHTSNRSALNDILAELTTAEKEDKAISHALSVRSALALGNYHRFFRLYLDTPNMGAYLMDMFVERERLAALCNVCKA